MKVLDAVKKGVKVAHSYKKLILVLFCMNLLYLAIPTVRTKLSRLMTLIFMIVVVFVEGGITGSIRDILTEEKFWGRQFLRYAKKYFARLLGFYLLIFVVVFTLMFIIFKIGFIRDIASFFLPTVVGGVLGWLLFLIVFVFTFYTLIIIVLEDGRVFNSIERSFKFVKQYFGKVLGLVGIGLGALLIGNGIFSTQKIRGTGTVVNPVVKIIGCAWSAYISVIFTTAAIILYLALTRKPSPKKE
ncbi:hypothetical protein KAT51_05770 [bacterium]|nr:hypothetical protein [bacterium]